MIEIFCNLEKRNYCLEYGSFKIVLCRGEIWVEFEVLSKKRRNWNMIGLGSSLGNEEGVGYIILVVGVEGFLLRNIEKVGWVSWMKVLFGVFWYLGRGV